MNFVLLNSRSGGFFLSWLLNLDGSMPADSHGLLKLSGNRLIADATEYYEGKRSRADIDTLVELYQLGFIKVDVCWKLPWIIEPLLARYPRARVVHLTRDPRENVRSMLQHDYYGSVLPANRRERLRMKTAVSPDGTLLPSAMQSFLPELPVREWSSLSQLDRISCLWAETHRLILKHRPSYGAYLRIKLEELQEDPRVALSVFDFLGLASPGDDVIERALSLTRGVRLNDKEGLYQLLEKRGKARCPPFPRWDSDQRAALVRRCGEMASELGYGIW